MRVLVCAWCVGLVLIAACSSFSADETPVGGEPDASGTEASQPIESGAADAAEAGAGDAPRDAPVAPPLTNGDFESGGAGCGIGWLVELGTATRVSAIAGGHVCKLCVVTGNLTDTATISASLTATADGTYVASASVRLPDGADAATESPTGAYLDILSNGVSSRSGVSVPTATSAVRQASVVAAAGAVVKIALDVTGADGVCAFFDEASITRAQ